MQYSHSFHNHLIKSVILRTLSPLLSFAAIWIGVASLCGQNLIQNGDFEAQPYAPSTAITNWTVSGTGAVHEINEGFTTPTHAAALNIGGDSQGTIISQTFPTAPGELYRVDFDSGIFGQRTGSPLQLNVQVTGSATLINDTVTPPDAFTNDTTAVVFRHYYYSFTANSNLTTIQFSDIGLGNQAADTMVDTVSVAPEENLLVNGGFETGPFDTLGSVSGWTVDGNGNIADRSQQGSAGGSYAAAFSAGADSQGDTLSQTFATTVGKVYILDFYAGVYGVPDNGANLQLEVQVLGAGTIMDQPITPPVQGTFDPTLVRFQHFQFAFTANSTATTLRFTDIGLGNKTADVMLDTVSVAPEPTQLVNGDFETEPYESFSITGWTVSGTGRIEEKMQGATTPTHSAAFGTGGNFQGSILSQSFPTIIGRQYSLDFDSGVFGMPTSMEQMQIQLLGTGTLLTSTITPPVAFTYNPSAMIFKHYHLLFIANTNTTALQFQDIGTGNASADPEIDTVSVALQPAWTFARWQASHFSQSQLNNPNVSGWSADPDRDGIRNGLEYFFNTDPLLGIRLADAASLPQVSITTAGASRYLTFTYRRPVAWSGKPEIVAVSDNLASWDETGSQIEQVSGPTPTGDGFTESITVRLKTPINQGPIPRKFLRLELTQ
jgi:hypothetical protein